MKTLAFRAASICALLALQTLIAGCGGPAVPPADLVLRGGKVATVDDAFSIAEAVAVAGGRIVKVGSDDDIAPYIGPDTEVIELGGRLAVPGLIDAHAHVTGLGASLMTLDFRGTTSFREIIDMVAEKAASTPEGEWITGRSWDQNDWPEKEFPTHHALSEAVPDHPVFLRRIDGHAVIVNRKAMELSGITKETGNPDGGEILRDSNGEATGVFVDAAIGLVSRNVSSSTPHDPLETIELAAQSCLAVGLTGVHDAGASPATINRYKHLIDNDRLGIRIYAMLSNPGDNADVRDYLAKNLEPEYGGHMLSVRSIKLFADGALGSRGALMYEPYDDRPGYTGLQTIEYDRMLDICRAALAAGCQVCTHAIGDKGNGLVLDAYEQALKENPVPDHRFRIEHAQVVAPPDFKRFAGLGVIPSMQPTHATSDMYWAEDRVGPERVKGAYAWRRFLDEGCEIPCGSDFPVEEHNPMLGIYAGITRQDPDGWPEGGWFPDQRMTREEVLRGFTIWAARAAFQEDILGSIEEGKLADITVLSKDILTVEPKEILATEAVYTIVGGRIRYSGN